MEIKFWFWFYFLPFLCLSFLPITPSVLSFVLSLSILHFLSQSFPSSPSLHNQTCLLYRFFYLKFPSLSFSPFPKLIHPLSFPSLSSFTLFPSLPITPSLPQTHPSSLLSHSILLYLCSPHFPSLPLSFKPLHSLYSPGAPTFRSPVSFPFMFQPSNDSPPADLSTSAFKGATKGIREAFVPLWVGSKQQMLMGFWRRRPCHLFPSFHLLFSLLSAVSPLIFRRTRKRGKWQTTRAKEMIQLTQFLPLLSKKSSSLRFVES